LKSLLSLLPDFRRRESSTTILFKFLKTVRLLFAFLSQRNFLNSDSNCRACPTKCDDLGGSPPRNSRQRDVRFGFNWRRWETPGASLLNNSISRTRSTIELIRLLLILGLDRSFKLQNASTIRTCHAECQIRRGKSSKRRKSDPKEEVRSSALSALCTLQGTNSDRAEARHVIGRRSHGKSPPLKYLKFAVSSEEKENKKRESPLASALWPCILKGSSYPRRGVYIKVQERPLERGVSSFRRRKGHASPANRAGVLPACLGTLAFDQFIILA